MIQRGALGVLVGVNTLIRLPLFALCLSIGCNDASDGEDCDGGHASDAANNSGDGIAGDTSAPVCVEDDPGGLSCSSGGTCLVECHCGDAEVTSGRCFNGVCARAQDVCEGVCDELGGYTGQFCDPSAEGEGGAGEGGEGEGGEGEGGEGEGGEEGGAGSCVDAADACEASGDCCGFSEGEAACVAAEDFLVCADTCSSDSECMSDCCTQTEEGVRVCAPPSYC